MFPSSPDFKSHVEVTEEHELIPFMGKLHIRVRHQTMKVISTVVEKGMDIGGSYEVHRPIETKQFKRELMDFVFVI